MEKGERRRYLRVEDFRMVWFRLVEKPYEYAQQGHGFQKDIGGGGIRLLAAVALDPGQWIELNLELPGPPPFEILVLGEVAWRRELGDEEDAMFAHGIRFLDLSEEDRRRLIRYCYLRQKKG